MSPETDPLVRLLARLDELGRGGRGPNRCCPAHDDCHPSLRIARGQDGRVLLHCHAGCTTSEVLAALGLTWQDLFMPADRIDASEPRPKVELIEDRFRRGELKPEPVELGELPPDYSPDMWRIAEDFRFLLGLHAAAGERRPMPYSARFAASRMGWPKGRMRANIALRALVKAGVIDRMGELPARGHARGTALYAAPLARQRPTVEIEAVPQPALEVPHQSIMNRAKSTRREDVRVVTAGDRAVARYSPVAGAASGGLDVLHTLNFTGAVDVEHRRQQRPRTSVTRDVGSPSFPSTSSCQDTSSCHGAKFYAGTVAS